MGVYNPNMDKSKDCRKCPRRIQYDDGWSVRDKCLELNRDIYYKYDDWVVMQDDCPLIEIDLVMCEECKYYNGHEQYCEIDHFARENGFCSSGKRRTDYTIFTVNPPKGVETPLKGDATVFHKNSKMGEKVARPTATLSTEVPSKLTATSSTEVPWWIEGE